MIKSTTKRVTSPRVRSKSPKIDDFMKNSMISPVFQYPEENYPISHQSHAPHTSHTPRVVEHMSDKSVPSEDSEGYASSNSSSGESYIDNETNEMIPMEETYANATRKKDLKIYRMKDLLNKKRKLMFEKEREIKELGNQNSFLETVVHDYENYNTVILEEKIKQKKALKILSDHIREISKNINSDEFKLNRVKVDQTLLLDEIQNIRDEIEYVLSSSGSNNKYMSSDDESQNDYRF
jgi:hypothetical protein